MAQIEAKVCNSCGRKFERDSDFLEHSSRWRVCERRNLWVNCDCGSTLMIPPGRYPWYAPEKLLSEQASGLFNKIGSLKNLPHMPSSIMELQQLLSSSEIDPPVLAKKVRQDPFIAANILTVANNIKSNRDPHDRKKIESIEHAIVYIGKKSLSDIVMAVSLTSIQTKAKKFSSEQFWNESFLVGDIAEAICNKFNVVVSRDELYISAVLCNLGKLVAAIIMPDLMDAVIERVEDPKTLGTWSKAEYLLGAPNHCVLGEIGAAFWGLPGYVSLACSNHHSMSEKPRGSDVVLLETEVIALANQLSHWVLLRPSRIDRQLIDKITKVLKMTNHDMEVFAHSLTPLTKSKAS